ncbi:hypothetical protein [Geobacter sp. SVR]|uniref:hypothetical protein n=1 Tax=Geobacter sp. SVR TaxID=2495594 RepID=UPI00143F0545|nr:hypothetical protein [Geobacter sp. SVR]BCS54216.1 hypothetical protein GSVR_25240 [Geobacter sp. SVR]GCF85926.1 hypothetical protein GSbR_25260 [Geobacter sp. SVR]
MRIITILLMLAMFALQACSTQYVVQRDLGAYPFNHRDFDYHVAWKTSQPGDGVVIDGLLRNVRYASIDEIEVTVDLVAPDGKDRSHATVFPVPQYSRQDDVVPFGLKLPNVAAMSQGDTLRFMLHYRGSDGGGDDNGIEWRSVFTVNAMSGAEVEK